MKRSLPIVAAIVVMWIVAMFSTTLSNVIFVNDKESQIVIQKNDVNGKSEPTLIIFYSDNGISYGDFEPTNHSDPGPDPPWPPDTTNTTNVYEGIFFDEIY